MNSCKSCLTWLIRMWLAQP